MDETIKVEVELTERDVAALDLWIDRQRPPLPTRGAAIREIVAGTLGSHHDSTIIPNPFTGRDIV